jgi:WD40 repeat protein
VIALIVLGCICVAVGGGFLYLRSQNQAGQDVSSLDLENPQNPAESTVSTLSPVDPAQPAQPTLQAETDDAQSVVAEQLLVVTSSGLWAVNEVTHEAVQLSFDQLDNTWDLQVGMSPDKKVFAYLTGFGGASINPMLVVFDLEKNYLILQIKLTGLLSQPGMENIPGESAFEAIRAMQFTDSLAWSPDGQRLAFVGAQDGDSADVYLFDREDASVTRLSDEAGHASALHWSSNGQFIEYVSVNSFGTGAGFDMNGLLVYDFNSKKAQLLETLDSNGEDFLAWMDNSQFLINSISRTCGGADNLRIVDASSFNQQVIVDQGFTAAAYDPENKFGMLSVAYNYDNCGSGEPLGIGLMIFGEAVPVLGADGPIIGEFGFKKFEEVTAYSIGFNPQGNFFTIYGEGGLQNIYYDNGKGRLNILPEVKDLVPYPSPGGDYWAWASSWQAGLWITENNSNPFEISPPFTGRPVWSWDGKTMYFIENDRILLASSPYFVPEFLQEVPDAELQGLVK